MLALKNNQINLFPLEIQEAKNEYEIFKNPKLFIYTKRQAFKNIQEAEAFIDKHKQLPNFFGIYLNQGQKLIGNCQLNIGKNQQQGEIAYSIDESYWGKGIATEAAECLLKLGFSSQFLNKISASCVPDNIGSKKVLEKNGMRYIGITKKAFKKDGTAFDLDNFEITKEVYLEKDH